MSTLSHCLASHPVTLSSALIPTAPAREQSAARRHRELTRQPKHRNEEARRTRECAGSGRRLSQRAARRLRKAPAPPPALPRRGGFFPPCLSLWGLRETGLATSELVSGEEGRDLRLVSQERPRKNCQRKAGCVPAFWNLRKGTRNSSTPPPLSK